MKKIAILALGAVLAVGAPAAASDLQPKPVVQRGEAPKHLCWQGKRIFTELSLNQIMERVNVYHDEAVLAAERSQSSRSMRHTWALETKAWCGVAIGYSKTRSLDEETIAKCVCFHWTMINQR